jgi:uncharacterized protein
LQLSGTFSTGAPREKVFDLLMDPQQLSACMPGLKKLTVKSPDEFVAEVTAGVSFIKGDFTMNFKVAEKDRPGHAKLVARGTGMGSTIDLETVMELQETNPGTKMDWKADARVGGRIASVGQRLLNSQAEKIVNQLFDCLKGKVEAI